MKNIIMRNRAFWNWTSALLYLMKLHVPDPADIIVCTNYWDAFPAQTPYFLSLSKSMFSVVLVIN